MGNETETNQKMTQKRIWLPTVLVAIVVVMIVLCVKVDALDKRLEVYEESAEASMQETIKNELFHDETTDSEGDFTEGTGQEPTQDAPQPSIEPLEAQRPEDVTEQETEALHKVYLTFDDGPSKNTEAILDILDEYGVKATFFVVGKEDSEAARRMQMIYERGHTIGMHSFTHDYSKIYHSVEDFREDFLMLKQYIYDATGVETTYFRFPGGSSNLISELNMTEFVTFIEEQGVEYYDWNVSSGDGTGKLIPVDMLVKNCTEMIPYYETSIILLHDSAPKTTTVEALPEIIETILAMEDTVILPITENTRPVHHVIAQKENPETTTEETSQEENVPEETTTEESSEEADVSGGTVTEESSREEDVSGETATDESSREEDVPEGTATEESSGEEDVPEGTVTEESSGEEDVSEEAASEDAAPQVSEQAESQQAETEQTTDSEDNLQNNESQGE